MEEWIEVELIVPAAVAETAGFLLAELGSQGVTLENRELDTFVPPDPDEMVSETMTLKAYFRRPEELAPLLDDIHQKMEEIAPAFAGWTPQPPTASVVRNEDWAEGWKQHFPTTRIGRRLVVRPSWEEFASAADDVVIEIDPGMAFGTGTHGTTRLCLEAVAAAFEGENPPQRVLDVGAGSGILAIAAAAYGAAEVVACEIDPDACAIAFENAATNQLDDLIAFTIAPLEELEGEYDLILANILAEENIRLAHPLLARLAPGGLLVLSGILIEKETMVTAVFDTLGIGSAEIHHLDEWCAILYRRP